MEKSIREIERDRRRQARYDHFHGEGRYIFENNTTGDFQLPKPSLSGGQWVKKGATFQGDSFFLKLVPQYLKLITEVSAPPKKENINESTESSKLLLDQPDIITQSGKVEHIVESQEDTQLNDSTENKITHAASCTCDTCSDQMLLTEDPMDGVDIIID